MFKDVTGFIVKLIMVNKCWLPTDVHFVFVLLHSGYAFTEITHEPLDTFRRKINPLGKIENLILSVPYRSSTTSQKPNNNVAMFK